MRVNRHRAGYTLVECLVGLSIVGLMVAGALALVGQAAPTWRLRQAAGDIASTLRAARVKAVQEGGFVIVPFDVESERFVIVTHGASSGIEVRPDPGDPSSTQRTLRLPDHVRFARPDGQAVVTLSPPGTYDTAAQFNSKGLLLSRSSPGYVYLGVPEKSIYRRVKVNVVGTISVETWNGSKWV